VLRREFAALKPGHVPDAPTHASLLAAKHAAEAAVVEPGDTSVVEPGDEGARVETRGART
jgi:hypothetical protein